MGLLYPRSAPIFDDIINQADKELFKNILSNSSHVLHATLPPTKTYDHNLRCRTHARQLPQKTSSTAPNFPTRMLYNNIY